MSRANVFLFRNPCSSVSIRGFNSQDMNPSSSPTPHRAEAVLSLIGHTPMVTLRFEPEGLTLHAKCEFLNPSGSIKDRLAKTVLVDAERRGLLRPDSIVLECTSGNTGIALSMVGAAMGYRVAILMSAGASEERRRLIRQLGAELILFESAGRYQTGIEMSREMAAKDSRYFLPRQFENPLNVADHEHETGQEILGQAEGPIDAFVTGFGTGGTLAGCGKAIKARWPKARILAMEPAEQALLAGETPCCHFIEGVADGFIPPLLRDAPLDGNIKVTSAGAMAMTRRLQRQFGLLVGTSSGANVVAALELARELSPSAKVVTLLCDRAERYFSTSLFDEAREGN
jgi:cysteine synthase A